MNSHIVLTAITGIAAGLAAPFGVALGLGYLVSKYPEEYKTTVALSPPDPRYHQVATTLSFPKIGTAEEPKKQVRPRPHRHRA
jgi:hypothetical protein